MYLYLHEDRYTIEVTNAALRMYVRDSIRIWP